MTRIRGKIDVNSWPKRPCATCGFKFMGAIETKVMKQHRGKYYCLRCFDSIGEPLLSKEPKPTKHEENYEN